MRCNEEGVGRSHPNNDSFAGRSIMALPVLGSKDARQYSVVKKVLSVLSI